LLPIGGRIKEEPLGAERLKQNGRLAQLVERLLYTQDVGGSIPSPPTSYRSCNQTGLAIYGANGTNWEGIWTYTPGPGGRRRGLDAALTENRPHFP
jgi:hypothetical protein